MSRNEGGKRKSGNDSDKGKLINEIDTISKAIYPERNPIRSSASSSSSSSSAIVQGKSIGRPGRLDSLTNPKPRGIGGGVSGEPQAKDKKSFWNWKPLKAISQARSRKFNCHFTLQVHTIEGLPSVFNGSGMCVHWKRRDGELVVGPVKVVEGVAEFEEQLAHTCSVHANRSGPNHSAKYEAKLWSLYASVDGKVDGEAKPDLGKHCVDLTRILPLTFEELDEEKNTRKWTTAYKLQGKAAGAVMNVSFGYLVLRDNPFLPPNNKIVLERLSSKQHNAAAGRSLVRVSNDDGRSMVVRSSDSLPKDKRPVSANRSLEDIKVLHEVFPVIKNDLSESLNVLDQMFEVEKSDSSVNDGCGVDVSVDQSELAELSLHRTDSFKENVVCGNNDSSTVEKVLENIIEEKAPCSGEIETVTDHHDEVESHDISANCSNIEASVEADPIIEQKLSDNNVEESKESILEDLDIALNDVADLEKAGLDTPEGKSESGDPENNVDGMSNIVEMPLSLEDLDCAESEFLNLLGVEEDPLVDLICEDETFEDDPGPESPRELLLREFERETEASGYSLFGFDFGEEDEEEYAEYNAPRVPEWAYLDENFELPIPSTTELSEEHYSAHQVGTSSAFTVPRRGNFADDPVLPPIGEVSEDHEYVSQTAGWHPRAKVLEDLETDALMREWGLNEETFQRSPPHHTAASASPSELTHEDPSVLPTLGDGLGAFVQTKNGGFLRSMNPTHFRDSKSGGSLIMQVSSPVVVPAEMGSGVMEMLENLASLGMERLSTQANKLMPLEDITGKTMQQIAWEAVPQLETNERQDVLQHVSDPAPVASGGHRKNKRRSSKSGSRTSSSSVKKGDLGSEYVSLEDLAPLAVDKIEALSIEGLKIQSGMSEEEAPSSIRPKSLGAEGAVGLQLLDVRDNSDDVDGLMAMSLTLDEWMRLDSGEIDEDEMKNERTSKILSAHHASSTDLTSLGRKGNRKSSKGPSGRRGLFGNNFTVALMVQLRDPLRDYEPVGTPMLALIQVERVFVPPKQKIYSTVSEVKKNDDDDDDDQETEMPKLEKNQEDKKEEKIPEEGFIPQYKVAEVHVAGLKTELGKKKLWGSATQQQSGSRWLLANGMGKAKKQPFAKTKAGGKASQATTIAQSGDTLWSISTQVHGTGAKWKELVALNPHIRNPNVVIPTGSVIRIR